MDRLKKILEAEIAQRELALKHKPLNSSEIEAELEELREGLVKLFTIGDVIGGFCIGAKVKITNRFNGHQFEIGEEVLIIGGGKDSWGCKNKFGKCWWVEDCEAEFLK